MNVGTYAPPKRTRQVIACELELALGRIGSLRKSADCLEPDSESNRQMTWYTTRASLLRKELETLNGAPRRTKGA